jgi:hypothetical protein
VYGVQLPAFITRKILTPLPPRSHTLKSSSQFLNSLCQLKNLPTSPIFAMADALKAEGNKAFAAKDFTTAV